MDLVHVWTLLVGLVIILYVVLDGFVLGAGILFLSAPDDSQRDTIMGSVTPVWDVNQTWIVFGGGALFAAFPTTYAVLFSALYIPLLLFLFGLIFRGIALEFRAGSSHRVLWDRAFFGGSLVAAFSQGVVLGAYLSGIKTEGFIFSGGAFDWLTPFSLMVGTALVCGYSLLGATFLAMKTTGSVRERALKQAFYAALLVGGFMLLTTVWTPLHAPDLFARWLSKPRLYVVWSFPLLGGIAYAGLLRSLSRKREHTPFFWSILLFISAYLGLQAAVYPNAVLPGITIYQAAAQAETLRFTLWGVAVVLPVVMGYTLYAYWVFRGKVQLDDGYH